LVMVCVWSEARSDRARASGRARRERSDSTNCECITCVYNVWRLRVHMSSGRFSTTDLVLIEQIREIQIAYGVPVRPYWPVGAPLCYVASRAPPLCALCGSCTAWPFASPAHTWRASHERHAHGSHVIPLPTVHGPALLVLVVPDVENRDLIERVPAEITTNESSQQPVGSRSMSSTPGIVLPIVRVDCAV
jgi:hypothetical protein